MRIAKIVTKKLFAKPIAVASAIGMLIRAVNPVSIATKATTILVNCRQGRRVLTESGKLLAMVGVMMATITNCRTRIICVTCSRDPASFISMAIRLKPAAAIKRKAAPCICSGSFLKVIADRFKGWVGWGELVRQYNAAANSLYPGC